jgi:zinc transport system permease protein
MSHLVVARRLAFFSTALGQAALTGLTLGLLAGEPIQAPYAGIFGFCLVSAILMVYVKRRSRLPPDTLVGVFMALTLGLGICLLVAATKQFNIHQIEAVMFGSLLTVTDTDLLLLVVAAAGVLAVLARFYNALLLDSLGRPLASASGVNTALCEYLFVVLLTLAIVVSLKVIGALLVEALVVVPAAAARNLARSTRGYLAYSVASALVTGAAGIFLSTRFRVPTGGAVVLALAACFFVTLAIGAGLRRGEGR